MTDFEFAKELGLAIEQYKNHLSGQFRFNQVNAGKFAYALKYFKELAKENNGKVYDISFAPRDIHASFFVEVPLISFSPKETAEFAALMSRVDTFDISPSANDAILIGVGINNIWDVIRRR